MCVCGELHSKQLNNGANRVKVWEFYGFRMYKCAMCETWTDVDEHIIWNMEWFKLVWDEQDIDQMMGSDTYSIITRQKISKPYICPWCYLNEVGLDEKVAKLVESMENVD